MQELIDDVVPEVLPAMTRKGLQLLLNTALPAGEQRYGDREALRRTLVPVSYTHLDVYKRQHHPMAGNDHRQ